MRIATAALRKNLRIMRTPEDSSKLSQQVPREQKFRAMLDRTVIVGAGIQGAWLSAPRDRGAPGRALCDGESTAQMNRGAKRR